jgi:hypothetical protein
MTDIAERLGQMLDRAGIRREDYIGDTPLELCDRIEILIEDRDDAIARAQEFYESWVQTRRALDATLFTSHKRGENEQ